MKTFDMNDLVGINITKDNIDEYILCCKKLGFNQIIWHKVGWELLKDYVRYFQIEVASLKSIDYLGINHIEADALV